MPDDDAELLGRFVATRADEAFAALVARHIGLVYAAAVRRVGGDVHLAQDVTQQVFVALARQAPALCDRPSLAPWLYTTTRFSSAQLVRAERRRQAREQQAHLMQHLTTSPGPDPEWERLRPWLDEAMDRLSSADREALLLRFFEKRSFAQLGAVVRLGEDAARKRVERALERLRVQLARRGVSSTGGALGLLLAQQATAGVPVGLAGTVSGAALSAGAGSGGVALLGLSLMHSTKIVTIAAASLLLLATGVALRQVQAQREAAAELAHAEESRDLARLRLAAVGRRVPAVPRPSPEAAKGSLPAAPPAPLPGEQEGRAFLAAHPAVRQAFLDTLRSHHAGRYAALFRELQLSPGDQARFLEIVARHGNGGAMGPNGFMIFLNDEAGSLQSVFPDLRELLGEDGYRRFRDYDDKAPDRRVAGRLASTLFFSDEPLSPPQAMRLEEVLRKNTPGPRRFMPAFRDWEAITAAGGEFLTTGQLAALERVRRLEEYDGARFAR